MVSFTPEQWAKFWSRVLFTDRCWIWITRRGSPWNGYGCIYVDGIKYRSHVLSHEYFIGPVQTGLEVCHHCDNKPCVNPAHLFLGTHAENCADAAAKGRMPRGSRAARAKLTEEDIPIIRAMRAGGVSTQEIGIRYGVDRSAIYKILWRRRWRHVPVS